MQGDRETEIGRWHHTARQAEAAIRDYCRQNLCTAFVRIFTPQAELWREEWMSVAGKAMPKRPAQGRTGARRDVGRGLAARVADAQRA